MMVVINIVIDKAPQHNSSNDTRDDGFQSARLASYQNNECDNIEYGSEQPEINIRIIAIQRNITQPEDNSEYGTNKG